MTSPRNRVFFSLRNRATLVSRIRWPFLDDCGNLTGPQGCVSFSFRWAFREFWVFCSKTFKLKETKWTPKSARSYFSNLKVFTLKQYFEPVKLQGLKRGGHLFADSSNPLQLLLMKSLENLSSKTTVVFTLKVCQSMQFVVRKWAHGFEHFLNRCKWNFLQQPVDDIKFRNHYIWLFKKGPRLALFRCKIHHKNN